MNLTELPSFLTTNIPTTKNAPQLCQTSKQKNKFVIVDILNYYWFTNRGIFKDLQVKSNNNNHLPMCKQVYRCLCVTSILDLQMQ